MKLSTKILYFLSIPYIMLFSLVSYSLMPVNLDFSPQVLTQIFISGVVGFSPYLYFILNNSKNNIVDFDNRSHMGRIAISLMIFILFALISFYLLCIGKLLYHKDFIDFLGYSIMPPIFIMYLSPYMMYRYSKNKEGFYKEVERIFNNFG